MPTTVQQDEANTRREYIRKDVFNRISPTSKSDEEKQNGKLDRAQLYLFLTEMALRIMHGEVLVSRMSKQHFWCQTGFAIENNVVYAKYGDSPYQPIGWDTGTEFYPLDIAKLLWKHEFSWFDPWGNVAEAPWDVTIEEVSIDEVEDPDGSALTDKERRLFISIMKDLKEEMEWTPPKDWKRSETFVPRTTKRKHDINSIMELSTKWIEERQDDFMTEAEKRVAIITDTTPYQGVYDSLTLPEGEERPDFKTWLHTHVAEELAAEGSAAYAKSLHLETEPYTSEELDELAKKAEHEFRVRETLKMAAMNSPRLDRKIEKIIAEHPEVGSDLENLDILSFTAQTIDWIRMRLDEDEAARIVRGTTVTPRITFDQIRDVEAKTAGFIAPELRRVLDSIDANGGIRRIDENDPMIYEAQAVVTQAQSALPGVAKMLAEHVDDILIDEAITKILEYFDEKEFFPKKAEKSETETVGDVSTPDPDDE